MATKRTWQPKKRRRMRVHGFLARMATRGGRKVRQRATRSRAQGAHRAKELSGQPVRLTFIPSG